MGPRWLSQNLYCKELASDGDCDNGLVQNRIFFSDIAISVRTVNCVLVLRFTRRSAIS